jgi:tetratricopeptide (TPR) repeat protein
MKKMAERVTLEFSFRQQGRGWILLSLLFLFPPILFGQTAVSPVELVRRAEEYLAAGREQYDRASLESAVETARRALESNERYGEAHLILAEAFVWLSAFDQAASHIESARSLRYGGIELDLLESRLAVLEGRFDDARRLFDDVLRKEPYNEDALVGRTLLNLADGFRPTERELLRLEQRYPRNRQLLISLVEISAEREDSRALRRYLDLALRHHGDSAVVQLTAARMALQEGDLEAAEFHGRNTVTIAPGMREGWLFLAEAARRAGKYGEAMNHYETLIRMDPQDHNGWYARGTLAARQGDRQEAFRSWDRALSIRPDYELATFAKEHHAMEELPLESPVRRELAAPYRRRGQELEEQYLFRQAEQMYRRGLQIFPFDTNLRRRLAELYLNQDMRGRYLRELEIMTELDDGRELTDEIEVYRSIRRDSVARLWDVDQFVLDRPRTAIAIFYRTTPETLEPNAGSETARYLESLLMSSQNAEIVTVAEEADSSRASLSASMGRAGADLGISMTVRMEDRRIVLTFELLPGNMTTPLLDGTVVRTGNDRMRNALREVARRVEEVIPVQGYVIDRRRSEVLVSFGSVDGVEPGESVDMYATPDNRFIGSAEVLRTDDLVSVVAWVPEGPDLLGTGDRVVFRDPNGESDPSEDTTAESAAQPSAPGSGLVQSLFRLR